MSGETIRNCPVCGGKERQPYLEKGTLRLVRCTNCGMVYTETVSAELASGKFYEQLGKDYYLSSAKLESDYAPSRYERELRLFRKYCLQGAVLDVGCGSGGFLFQLQERFPGDYQVLGTDASGPALEHARSKGIAIVSGDFLANDFDGRRFDAITFWAVTEHLAEPRAFLTKASSLLAAGGVCFVLVPNLESLAVRLLGKKYRYIYEQHLNYFTRETLKKLGKAADLIVIEVESTHFNPLVIWQDWRAKGRDVSNVERAELLKRTTGYKQNPLLWPVKVMYGLAERVLGSFYLADNLVAVLLKK